MAKKGLKLTVKIEGKTLGDLEIALERVKSQVAEGYVTGHDRNESGNYTFDRKGEEIE
jgi:hypothetical protein